MEKRDGEKMQYGVTTPNEEGENPESGKLPPL